MVSLEVLLQTFEELWPYSSSEDWDAPGLMVGSKKQEISTVLLAVDATSDVLREALHRQANLLLTHHPLLMRGVHELGQETIKGNLVSAAIKSDLAIFAAHTNADLAEVGTARALAELIGLEICTALDALSGHGLVGVLAKPESLLAFSTRLAKLLPSVAAGIKVAGDPEAVISKVAVAPGAGDSFLQAARDAEVDVFITSDLRHHPAQDFLEANQIGPQVALIDISHWAAESIWLPLAQKTLSERHPNVEFIISDIKTDPWDFAVMQ